MFDFAILIDSLPEFAQGTWLSLQLMGLSLLAGFAAALPLAVARSSSSIWLSRSVGFYTYIFRGTPMLVQLLLIYYGLSQFEWMQRGWESGNPVLLLFREPFFCAWLAFTLNTTAYTTEIFAGVFKNTPLGEVEAGRAMGMTHFTLLRRIVIPAGLRRAIPTYSNEVILMLQGSAIASAVTLVDLTGAARYVYARHFAPFEAFIFAGIIYMLLTFFLVGIFRFAEIRWLAHLKPRS